MCRIEPSVCKDAQDSSDGVEESAQSGRVVAGNAKDGRVPVQGGPVFFGTARRPTNKRECWVRDWVKEVGRDEASVRRVQIQEVLEWREGKMVEKRMATTRDGEGEEGGWCGSESGSCSGGRGCDGSRTCCYSRLVGLSRYGRRTCVGVNAFEKRREASASRQRNSRQVVDQCGCTWTGGLVDCWSGGLVDSRHTKSLGDCVPQYHVWPKSRLPF